MIVRSDEPERVLLGAVLVSPGVINSAGDLRPEHFGNVRHATTWAAVQRLAAAGSELDLVTLKAELERAGELAAAGGALYLAQLLDGVPRFTTLASWADLVRGGARRRRLRTGATQLLEISDNGADPARVGAILDALRAEAPSDTRPGFVSAVDVVKAPAPEEIVEGLLFRNSVHVLAGESGAGKTFEAVGLAADIAEGIDHHGRRVTRGTVAYVSFESDALQLRLQALRGRGATLQGLYLLRALDPISPRVERDGTETPSLGETFLTGRLQDLAADLAARGEPPIAAVFIDTVRASLSGSEDSSESVSAYLRAARRILAAVPGAALVLLHHAGWQDGQEKRKRERGSSAFRGNVDATLYLEASEPEPDGSVRLTLRMLKARDAAPRPPLFLVRRKVDLPGFDCWGEPLSSCIVERDTTTREDRERATAARLDAEAQAQERALLHAILEYPEATSINLLRPRVGWGKSTVADVVARALRERLIVEGKRGAPYQITTGGRDLLGLPPSSGTKRDRNGTGDTSVPEAPRGGPGTPPIGVPVPVLSPDRAPGRHGRTKGDRTRGRKGGGR